MTGRVVVVTGGSSGIGRAAAQIFAARGDRVVLAARSRAGLEAAAAQIGGDVLAVAADISRAADVERVAQAAVERYGRIDIWVNTAAVMAYGRFEDIPAHVFDQVINTGVLGSANVARTALRRFREQEHGTLILCGSLLGHITAPWMSPYTVSKWALRGLARTLRQEARELPGVQVCLLSPGSVDTPIYTGAANYAGFVGRPPPPVDSAQRMGEAIVRLADRPRRELSVGATNGLFALGFTVLPGLYDRLVGPLMRHLALSRQPVEPGPGNVFTPTVHPASGPGRWGRTAVFGLAATGSVAALSAARLVARSRR